MAPDPILDNLSIAGFFDAAALCLDLSDRYGRYATAVGLGTDGTVHDLTVFTDDCATLDTALDWAHCLLVNDARVTQLVLMSSPTDRIAILSEHDLDDFRHARDVFGTWDVEILDWLQTDGDTVRSMRLSEGGEWPDG